MASWGTLIIGDANTMYNYAQAQTNTANAYIAQLGVAASSLTPPTINPVFPPGPSAPPVSLTPPPELPEISWTNVAPPPSFTGTLNVDGYLPEPFDMSPPAMVIPSAPAAFNQPMPTAPAVNTSFEFPTDPTVYLPPPPALLSLSVSSFGGINMPAPISSDIPELVAVQPSDFNYTPGAAYTSALLTSLKAALQDRIDNGGTGLPPEVEQAIWDRGRERETKQLADAIADLERMEALGYALPPGGYVDARIKLQTEFAAQAHGYSREVMIKAAELEQENVKHALTTATQLESKLVDYINQIEQRNFESQKYATQAGIEIYNAKVRAYTAYVDAYKVKVQIYLGQIDGEKAKVEVYKAQVQAEEAKAQINTALVNQYKAQIDGAMAVIQIYKAELDAVQTKANIEKLKVEVFGEQVKAYASQVNTYTAQIEAFKATVSAEATKQEAYKATVEAYAAEVGAQTKIIDAKIQEFEGKIKANNILWEGYKAQVQGEASRVEALAKSSGAISDVYKAQVQGEASYNETLTKQWQVSLDQAQRVVDIGVNAAKANAELYMTTRSLALDAAKVGAQVSAQLGAAALNAINWSSSVSTSDSTSRSTGTSYSYGFSFSTSFTP